MAARRSPLLIHKLEGHNSEIHAALIIPREEGIITAGSDKTVRVWLKRDNNQYWPSICHSATSPCTALAYFHEHRRLFVGLSNGLIVLFELSEDMNRMERKMLTAAHQARIDDIAFCPLNEWLLSVSRDKTFQWHCSQTGKRLGTLRTSGWCTKVVFDSESQLAFVSEYSGQVYILKLQAGGKLSEVNTLRAHTGSVQSMCWDDERKRLISAGYDKTIFIWDIGGGKGQTFELNGHFSKINSIFYSHVSRKLISACEDKQLGIWDLSVDREETVIWQDKMNCQICDKPFILNLKGMFEKKEMGKLQHHCRKCGKAVCDVCSAHSSRLPNMGYEKSVRVCNECMREISQEADMKPQAVFFDIGVAINKIDVDVQTGIMIGVSDRILRVWDIKGFVM